ncbi:MAG: pilus assembly protein TadG-related protein, partial [Acidimicrobiia bacterium]
MRRIVTLLERDEQGVALVVVAFSMFMLMAVATLAIDGGLVHTDRRQAQNVADNASLAAAWAICEGRDPT